MSEDEIELFGYECPYTDRPCYNNWQCKTCDVELEEIRWLSTEDDDEEEEEVPDV